MSLVISQIDDWIQYILKVPRMFGTCNESIELQIITLLEVKYLILNPSFAKDNPRYILGVYNSLLRKKYPHQNLPLFALVMDDTVFIEELRDITKQVEEVVYGK